MGMPECPGVNAFSAEGESAVRIKRLAWPKVRTVSVSQRERNPLYRAKTPMGIRIAILGVVMIRTGAAR